MGAQNKDWASTGIITVGDSSTSTQVTQAEPEHRIYLPGNLFISSAFRHNTNTYQKSPEQMYGWHGNHSPYIFVPFGYQGVGLKYTQTKRFSNNY